MIHTPMSSSTPNISDTQARPDDNWNKGRKRKQPECELTNAIITLTQEMNKKFEDLRGYLDCAVISLSDNVKVLKLDLAAVTQTTADIKVELNSLRSEQAGFDKYIADLEHKQEILREDMTALQSSVQYSSECQDDLKKRVDTLTKQAYNTEALNDMISGLELKIDMLEQQARQCNIELCNVPEKRAENLVTLMNTISSKINCSLTQKDIIAIHRVPHAQSHNKQPKNIIVKLSSRILRVYLLSAFRLSKGLKTDDLGISGSTPLQVYMNEHLTLKNKQLFRECREAAKKNNFKYVWIKHATILVRESDNTPAMAIRTHQDVSKIRSRFVSPKHT